LLGTRLLVFWGWHTCTNKITNKVVGFYCNATKVHINCEFQPRKCSIINRFVYRYNTTSNERDWKWKTKCLLFCAWNMEKPIGAWWSGKCLAPAKQFLSHSIFLEIKTVFFNVCIGVFIIVNLNFLWFYIMLL
jgi:hypothetical protein